MGVLYMFRLGRFGRVVGVVNGDVRLEEAGEVSIFGFSIFIGLVVIISRWGSREFVCEGFFGCFGRLARRLWSFFRGSMVVWIRLVFLEMVRFGRIFWGRVNSFEAGG